MGRRRDGPALEGAPRQSRLSLGSFCTKNSLTVMTDINTGKTAKLEVEGKTIALPIVEGSEHEKGMDISALRSSTGYITLDDGYGNTGSCQSGVTFIDGDKGILRYRGIPIEELADKSTFIETAYLLIYGHLPTKPELGRFSQLLTQNENLHEDMKYHFESFPSTAHPMAILSSMINASSCYYPGLLQRAGRDEFDIHAARLISQVRTIAAFSYRKSRGLPIIYPKPTLRYTANFLHMLFSDVYEEYDLRPEVVRALDLIFILHADHEQNCSTSTVRMVASAQANLFASAAAGVCALWGPLHGGANQAVIEMLSDIHRSGDNGSRFIAAAKEKGSGKKLMGFGHRIYKNYDPRARIIKKACDSLLVALNVNDPLLDIAKRMEEAALSDAYFVERKLYPNVDFYSGIIMRALNIPTEMFTVIFAIGRMPGWIAHFKEIQDDPKGRIYRPRQIYVGQPLTHFVPIDERVG
jgi:citrate synthase